MTNSIQSTIDIELSVKEQTTQKNNTNRVKRFIYKCHCNSSVKHM